MRFSILLTMILGVSMFFGAISIPNADAAVDMFLKLGGDIQGESQDKNHKDEIDVLAWSWGMSNSGSFHVGTGGGAGKANFQDLSVTKYIDKASPILMLYAANGDHFPTGDLTLRKAGGADPLEFYTLKMNKVLVTSVSTGGSSGEDRLTENITLNFESVKVEYTPQKNDGSADTPIEFEWDIAENFSQFP